MPEIIVVEATNRCNLNCRHCYKNINDMGGGTADIDLHLLDRVLGETERYNTRIVMVTGGEPTLHSDWEGLVAVLEKHDVDYVFTSNGTTFREAHKVLVRGATDRFKGIMFSLDGAKAETNDAIRGEGTFEKVMGAFKLARMHGIPFGIQTVLGSYNLEELAEIGELAENEGAGELSFLVMKPTLENLEYKLSPMQAEEAEEKIKAINEEHKRLKVGLTTGNKTPYPLFVCRSLAMTMIGIDSSGLLRFCPDLANYRGAVSDDSDIVVDLNTKPLQIALKDLSNKINLFWHKKIDWVMEGIVSSTEYDPCIYCLSHFSKYESPEM